MAPVRRNFGEWLAVTAALLLLTALLAASNSLGRFDNILYDLALRAAGRPAPADVVIVGIDDRSLAQIGRWPWRRALHAELLHRLAGARAIAFDVMFTEHDSQHPEDDQAFGAAVRARDNVILPVLNESHAGGGFEEILPIAPLTEAAAGFGHIERSSDADGIVRRAELWIQSSTQTRRPHLALALLGLTDPDLYRQYPPQATPVLIPYAGPPGHFHQYAYIDVLTGKVPPASWRDKIVFIGATATGLSDNVPTPVGQAPFDMPGVEVHATLFDALRSGIHGQRAPPSVAAAATGLSLTALLVLLLVSPPQRGLVASFGHALAWLLLPALALIVSGYWLPPGAALLGTMLAYPLWSWRRLAATQRWMDTEIATMANAPGFVERRRGSPLPDPFVRRIDQIRHAAALLRHAREEREQALQFLSHDLRAPLAAILTMLDGADDERSLRLAHHAGNALELADAFIQLARAEALEQGRFVTVDLVLLLDEAIDESWDKAAQGKIRIERCHEIETAPLPGDSPLLRRAFVNLLDNAVRYSPPETCIKVSLRENDACWSITIADQGYGIAAEDLEHLFEPFRRFRLPGQPAIAGNGLGLPMVKITVERHGGNIEASSFPGKGTSFEIQLPKEIQ